jgi:hypothetical protein
MNTSSPRSSSSALPWFFVTVWGCGYLATKTGLPDAPLPAWTLESRPA